MTDTQTQENIFEIDASGRSLGRVASEAAVLLMGKNDPSYERHILSSNKVTISNASKILTTARKRKGKVYTRYTGYPGGLRKETLDDVVNKKGYGEAFRRAVRGMLPDNKLRSEMLKNLTINE